MFLSLCSLAWPACAWLAGGDSHHTRDSESLCSVATRGWSSEGFSGREKILTRRLIITGGGGQTRPGAGPGGKLKLFVVCPGYVYGSWQFIGIICLRKNKYLHFVSSYMSHLKVSPCSGGSSSTETSRINPPSAWGQLDVKFQVPRKLSHRVSPDSTSSWLLPVPRLAQLVPSWANLGTGKSQELVLSG